MMDPYREQGARPAPTMNIIDCSDCTEWLSKLPDASIDACVTDPPYELDFMSKAWDRTGISFKPEIWAEVCRVLKPGGHILAFGGTRTYHRIACAIEDGGFDIRDCLSWLYGSGFPKSLNVSLAIDKALGVESTITGSRVLTGNAGVDTKTKGGTYTAGKSVSENVEVPTKVATSPEGQRWAGWQTALKPAWEPIILGRKPLAGTVARNVLEHGTGAINIDACRVGDSGGCKHSPTSGLSGSADGTLNNAWSPTIPGLGRHPANVILDPEAAAHLDEQAPGVSRYFYSPKASTREREAGLDHFHKASAGELTGRAEGSAGLNNPRAGAGRTSKGRANRHPTVKPIALMRYLIKLVVPPDGIVIDPFVGSGTTAIAAAMEGVKFGGCELDTDYVEIARARVAYWRDR